MKLIKFVYCQLYEVNKISMSYSFSECWQRNAGIHYLFWWC